MFLNQFSEITRLRIVYAFFFSVYGTLLPFLPIIFHDQHYTDSQISICFAAMGFAAFLPPLLTGHIADRLLPANRLVTVLLAAACFVIPFFYSGNSPVFSLFITFLFFFCFFPSAAILDALTLHYTASRPDLPKFPTIRVWGTVGFIVPSLVLFVLGYLIKIDGMTLVVLATLFCALTALISLSTPAVELPRSTGAAPSLQALRAALDPKIRNYIIGSVVSGVGLSIFYVFLPRYLQELGYSTVQIGLITNFGVLCEVIAMSCTQTLISWCGLRGLMLAAMGAVAIRLWVLASFPTFTVILISQALHAPIVLGFFVAAPMFIAQNAKESYRFSFQSVYMMLTFGVSRIAGTLLLAFLLDNPLRTPLFNLRIAGIWGGALGMAGLLWNLFVKEKTEPTSMHA